MYIFILTFTYGNDNIIMHTFDCLNMYNFKNLEIILLRWTKRGQTTMKSLEI